MGQHLIGRIGADEVRFVFVDAMIFDDGHVRRAPRRKRFGAWKGSRDLGRRGWCGRRLFRGRVITSGREPSTRYGCHHTMQLPPKVWRYARTSSGGGMRRHQLGKISRLTGIR
jgi:hypothetical protein